MMGLTSIGVEIRWAPKFIRDSEAHYYLVVPFLEYAELYGRLQEIMKSEGYRYVYAEKNTLCFEREKTDATVTVHTFESRRDGELLPQIAKQNGLEYNQAEEVQIVDLRIRKKKLLWE